MSIKKDKKVLIINTGGTICMTRSEKGFVPSAEKFEQLLEGLPELKSEELPQWDIITFGPLLDSSNVAINEWNKIGQTIAEKYNDYDGFVILHGTDTMAYTASVLSFMLENLGKPVILTGSQIPLSELRSDGKENLIASLMIATIDEINEVCIFFANKLLRGNRTVKFSASDFIAFLSPNYSELADAGINITLNKKMLLDKPKGEFHLQLLEKISIGVLKAFPGSKFDMLSAAIEKDLKGVVIEAFGAGNLPTIRPQLFDIIKKGYDSGIITTICSQCPQGNVLLGSYETSEHLREAGAVSGKDMTTEAAVAKLYYLFSKGLSTEEVKKQMEIPLRGEES